MTFLSIVYWCLLGLLEIRCRQLYVVLAWDSIFFIVVSVGLKNFVLFDRAALSEVLREGFVAA